MRCKNHYIDLSSTVGVCASCLRERLAFLVAAEEQVQAQVIQNFDGNSNYVKNPAYPSSVSPRVNSRKSDHRPPATRYHRDSVSEQLFYKTPQVDATTSGNLKKKKKNKRSFIRFLFLPNIFRSRNRKPVDAVSNPRASDATVRESCDGNTATSSSSWFSSIISGGRHRRKPSVYTDESSIAADGSPVRHVRRRHCRNRGMSPVGSVDGAGGDDESHTETTGYESTESWRNTPRRTPGNPAVRRGGGGGGGGGHVRSVSGITFCLSPLVRASPNRQWNQKFPPEVLLSGEFGAPVKAHLSNTKLFCANKSRKLADLGRPNPNR